MQVDLSQVDDASSLLSALVKDDDAGNTDKPKRKSTSRGQVPCRQDPV
jgi:hypothetical protein